MKGNKMQTKNEIEELKKYCNELEIEIKSLKEKLEDCIYSLIGITQSELKDQLLYDKETGIFSRNVLTSTRIKFGELCGNIRKDGYITISIKNKKVLAHRLAFLYMTGSIPEYVDHINMDKADNRWINLRPATKSQNQANTNKLSTNTSGFKGVSFKKGSNKNSWRARIKIQGKEIALGHYDTIEEAAKVYREAALKYHGEYAREQE